MDANHFDTLTTRLANSLSRRRSLGVLAALGTAGAGIGERVDAKKKKKPCPPCKKLKKGKCKATLRDGSACGAGTCQSGKCVETPRCGSGGPCLAFLSSSLHTGNLGGLSGGDAICQNLATDAGLPGTYKAWLSDATGSASSRFVPSPGPYQLVNGTQIAANFTDLTDGSVLAPIDVTETGGGVGSTPIVFTGTQPNGNAELAWTCANWTNGTGAQSGVAGVAAVQDPDTSWTRLAVIPCDDLYHLYCFQQR